MDADGLTELLWGVTDPRRPALAAQEAVLAKRKERKS